MAREATNRKSRVASAKSIFSWQGLWLELPPRWNPVKLEGDYERGYALFADLHRARLGVRWHKPRKPRRGIGRLLRGGGEFDPVIWSRHAMREEVGMLAAEEAEEWWGEWGQGDRETGGQGDRETGRQGDKGTRGQGDRETRGQGDKGTRGQGETGGQGNKETGIQGDKGTEGQADTERGKWGEKWAVSLLYLEPEPPGRDVWLGFSRESGRAVQVTHHANRREQILAHVLLPTLEDLPRERMVPWSVFELSCRVPGEMRLERHVLNAGDLNLAFAGGGRNVVVRQLAVAHLALKRLSLEKWLEQQMSIRKRHYRVVGKAEEVEVVIDEERQGDRGTGGQGDGGQVLKGLKQSMNRRRRFGWLWWIPGQFVTYVLHDEARDRLVIVQGTEEGLVREVAATVGWAAA